MSDVISDYQRWKQQGEDLRSKARQAMETRFRDLLLEAIKIAQEYRADFGGVLKAPPAVTAFRFKSGNKKAKKPGATTNAAPVAAKVAPPAAAPNPKVVGLRKRLATARKKLDAAKAAGTPTKKLDDRGLRDRGRTAAGQWR